MPRHPRVIYPGVPLHIVQRGNNRQACFFADEDYSLYLEWLAKYSKESKCAIHAFVLMTNHVHILLTPSEKKSAGDLMKKLGQRYVQHINRTQKRSGTLWEGRFRSCITQQEDYLLACQRYIELNPVRARMVENAGDYIWSSYHAHAHGQSSEVLSPHPLYLHLGKSDAERQRTYKDLFCNDLEPGMVDRIRKATNGNFVLGNDRFQDEIEQALGRRVTPGISGRPRKKQL